MTIKSFCIGFLFTIFFHHSFCNSSRRLGKLDGQSWANHYKLAQNQIPYESSNDFPDFSAVGALISDGGILGTATLIAPDTILTAAHVLKNKTKDPLPSPDNWKFILYHDYDAAPSEYRFSIGSFEIHPDWVMRQRRNPPYGDGDRLGVDLAIAKLKSQVVGVQPLRIPSHQFSFQAKVFLAGFGDLVEGNSGDTESFDSRRMAGENILDRVVKEIEINDSSTGTTGGLLAFDFDSTSESHNSLGDGYNSFDNIPVGTSDPYPLNMEVSTALGDSGGPLIAYNDNSWRIFGTVSYGTSDSTYGDVTVLTRLSNHLSWISEHLPVWPATKIDNHLGWRSSSWFGYFMPFNTGWNFHADLGWFWCKPKDDDSMWIYKDHLGWLWTGFSSFPFCFSNREQNWIFIEVENTIPTKWFVYSFTSKTWEVLIL